MWTCTSCGESADTDAVGLLARVGWWITDSGRGLCPRCAQRAALLQVQETLRRARGERGRDAAKETRRVASEMLEARRSQR
jgi:hypothetical protein